LLPRVQRRLAARAVVADEAVELEVEEALAVMPALAEAIFRPFRAPQQ
jgi:hypothetical protein